MVQAGGDRPASARADDDVIGRDGRFLGPAKESECADDEAIVAKAMRMGSGVDLEIRDHKRFVALLHGTKGTKGAR
jgi:hypothetical protein